MDYNDNIQEAYEKILDKEDKELTESEYALTVGLSTMSGEMSKLLQILSGLDPKAENQAKRSWTKLEKELKNILKKVIKPKGGLPKAI